MPYLPTRLQIDPSVFVAPGAVPVGVESILHNAKEYVEYARRYRQGELG